MNCWAVLQLEPTADVRAIKKAYAVLLKLNKPDENPAGFQQLHAAYQQALRWAEHNADAASRPTRAPEPELKPEPELPQQPAPEVAVPLQPDSVGTVGNTVEIIGNVPLEPPPTQPQSPPPFIAASVAEPIPPRLPADVPLIRAEPLHHHGQPFHPHEEPLSAEEEAWEDFLDQQWDTLVDLVEGVLERADLRNDPRAWDFLVHAEALLDIEFKAEFSLRFVQRLVQIFHDQQENGELMLLPDTVRYLNNTFWWDQRRHLLEENFEEYELDAFMAWWQPPAPATAAEAMRYAGPPVPYANYYKRWQALIIDLALLFGIGFGLHFLVPPVVQFQNEPVVFAALFCLAAYGLLNPLFEASPLQGSPGKFWCGMKVCDSQGQRIALWRAFLRCALFGVSLYFIYVTVIINMLIWDGRLLHDRLSGSSVLKRQP